MTSRTSFNSVTGTSSLLLICQHMYSPILCSEMEAMLEENEVQVRELVIAYMYRMLSIRQALS